MQHTRLWLITTFLITLSLGFILTRGEAQPNSVKQIAPGVWFREGDIEHEGHCNNAIIEMQDYLIIVDANFPSGARAVLADARKSPRSRSNTSSTPTITATTPTEMPSGPRWARLPSPTKGSPTR